jgi:hypothetical protein
MKKLSCKLLLILLSGIILTNCNDTTDPSSSKHEIMPLKLGNYWVNKLTIYDRNGNLQKTSISTAKITFDSVWNGEKIYRMGNDENPSNNGSGFYLNRIDGLYLWDIPNHAVKPELYWKYPANEGDKFISLGDSTLVERANIEYKVPAGPFKCYKYSSVQIYHDKTLDDTTTYNFYYSPGIGMIALETYNKKTNTPNYLQYKVELLDS